MTDPTKKRRGISVILSVAGVLLSIGVLAVNYYIFNENVFPMDSFPDRIVSRSTAFGIDIDRAIKIYIFGILLSGFLLFLSVYPWTGPARDAAKRLLKSEKLRDLYGRIRSNDILHSTAFKVIIAVIVVPFIGMSLFMNSGENAHRAIIGVFVLVAVLTGLKNAEKQFLSISVPDTAVFFSLLYSTFSVVTHLIPFDGKIPCSGVIGLILACVLSRFLKPVRHLFAVSLPAIYWFLTEIIYNLTASPALLFAVKTVLLAVCIFVTFRRPGKIPVYTNRPLCYLLFLISAALIVYTRNYYIPFKFEHFESANHGVAVFSLIRYGELPLFETFDAHILKFQIEQYLSILLGANYNDAFLTEYQNFLMLMVIFDITGSFLMFRLLVSDELSLLLAMFLPTSILGIIGMTFVPFVLLMTRRLMLLEQGSAPDNPVFRRKIHTAPGTGKKLPYYFGYWLLIVFAVLYSLDIGLTAVVSSFAAFALFCVFTRDLRGMVRYAATFGVTAAAGLGIAGVVCAARNIPVIELAEHFLRITMLSNQNWAYGELGPVPEKVFDHFFLFTFIITALIIFLCVYLFRKYKSSSSLLPSVLIITAAAVAWLVNIPRIIVRHNLMEYSAYELAGMPLFFCVLCVLFFAGRKKDRRVYLYVFLASLTLAVDSNLCVRLSSFTGSDNIISAGYSRVSERYDRTVFDTSESDTMREIFDTILEDDETYFDFTNQSLMYVLTERNNPIYENQSPGLISGEQVQGMTVKLLEDNKDTVVCAMIPYLGTHSSHTLLIAANDIPSVDSFYLISEYLHDRFVPVAYYSDFEIWVRKDNESEKRERIEKLLSMSGVGNVYRSPEFYDEKHDLGDIPFIWANYDAISPEERAEPVMLAASDGIYTITSDMRDPVRGNYLIADITVPADTKMKMTIDYRTLSDSADLYSFNARAGTHTYLFRVSTTYKWYCMESAELSFSDKQGVPVPPDKVSICTADILPATERYIQY